MLRTLLFTLMIFLFSHIAFAWNGAGHRVIAQIAYDQLTPEAKNKVDALTAMQFHSPYPESRFLRAAVWPDQIKSKTKQYNSWHYINLPYVKNNISPPALNPHHVVWAITQAEKVVADKTQTDEARAENLSFLIHFVGDIHQPLHCATLYDEQFPAGDRGGNGYPIDSPIAKNLHQFWDRGAGLFYNKPHDYQFHYWQVEQIALQWMKQYPRADFTAALSEQSPMEWAQESHRLAVNFVYTLEPGAKPSQAYILQSQQIVEKQSVLAGDRLADILNRLF